MTVSTGSSLVSLWGMETADFTPHDIHAQGRTYGETNCYADVLIELLHARGLEPLAALGFIVRTDWEGDQFSYFKPRQADLEALFGVEIHEMLPYRSIPEHIEEQLALGRTLLIEIDAWYLPDVHATSYRTEHLKTTVAPEAIDRDAERLRYFHNAGLFELDGEDYRGAFRLADGFTDDVMDPFTEVVSFDAGPQLEGEALRAASLELLRRHYAHRPQTNPFERFGASLERDLPRLLAGDESDYHAYAFVTVRMMGAAFELLADHVRWLFGADGAAAAAEFGRIVEASKILSFRLARRREFDPSGALGEMGEGWERGMTALGALL